MVANIRSFSLKIVRHFVAHLKQEKIQGGFTKSRSRLDLSVRVIPFFLLANMIRIHSSSDFLMLKHRGESCGLLDENG